jgi:uncharacterized protein
MSEEHVEIVRRFYEAFMRGDGEAALALYSGDAEWDDTRFRPEGKVHQGHEGLVELVRTWVGTWTDYSFDLNRIVDGGERIVAICEEHGTGKGSGLPMSTRYGAVLTVADGKITAVVIYPDPGEALRAAGLPG